MARWGVCFPEIKLERCFGVVQSLQIIFCPAPRPLLNRHLQMVYYEITSAVHLWAWEENMILRHTSEKQTARYGKTYKHFWGMGTPKHKWHCFVMYTKILEEKSWATNVGFQNFFCSYINISNICWINLCILNQNRLFCLSSLCGQ